MVLKSLVVSINFLFKKVKKCKLDVVDILFMYLLIENFLVKFISLKIWRFFFDYIV